MKQVTLLAAVFSILAVMQSARAQVYRYQAEDARQNGQLVGTDFCSTSVPGCSGTGYSGSGYITDFDSQTNSDYFTLQVDVPDGLYEMWVGYRSEYGEKGYTYQVDGTIGNGMFDQSNTFTADLAGLFNMTGGVNTLGIRENWGFYDVDYFEFRPYTPPTLLPVSTQLVDPQADRRTQMLMNYLVSQYGHKTLSGLQHNSSDNYSFPIQNYLGQSGGVVPAIRGSDLIDYSPSRIAFGENPQNETEQTIAWAKQTGGVVSAMWHWNAPANLINQPGKEWWRGFYADSTTFNLPGALANPAGSDYQLILRDIDAIAVQLQKYEDAGVPVLWRPLHEAQGGWFWWGAHGADSFKQLWNVMYDRLTNYHGLHNLIWEFTSIGVNGNEDDWYPGDVVVDMVGLDIYTQPTDNLSGQWIDALEMYNGRKMIALSETDTLVNPEVMGMWGTKWSYVSPWVWDYIRSEYANSGYSVPQLTAILQQFLNHEDVITLSELPILPWNDLAPALPGDYNHDNRVNAADYTLWRNSLGQTGTGLAADGDGNGTIDDGDYVVWRLYFGEVASGNAANGNASVPEPTCSGLLLGVLVCVLTCRRLRDASHQPGQ